MGPIRMIYDQHFRKIKWLAESKTRFPDERMFGGRVGDSKYDLSLEIKKLKKLDFLSEYNRFYD